MKAMYIREKEEHRYRRVKTLVKETNPYWKWYRTNPFFEILKDFDV